MKKIHNARITENTLLQQKYAAEIAAFKRVCEQSAKVDPNDERDWYDLSIGFFLALGVSIADTHTLAGIVRYQLLYWSEVLYWSTGDPTDEKAN